VEHHYHLFKEGHPVKDATARRRAMKLHLWLALGAALAVGTCGIGGSVRADGKPIADVDFLAEAITHGAFAVRASELARNTRPG
jgi:hypothetical protein